MTAGLFNSMFNLGNLMSPLVSGVLNDWRGYKYTTDTMMIGSSIYVAILIFGLSKRYKN